MGKRKRWVLFCSVALVLLLFGGGMGLLRGLAGFSQPAPLPPEIDQLRAALHRDGLSAKARGALEEKIALAERAQPASTVYDPAALEAKNHAAAPALESAAAPLRLEEQFPEELFEDSQGLIRPAVAAVINGWQGVRDGTALQMFAGSMPEDPQTGVVVVLRIEADSFMRSMQIFTAPDGAGALRIVEVHAEELVLSGANGDWRFDWTSGVYTQQ